MSWVCKILATLWEDKLLSKKGQQISDCLCLHCLIRVNTVNPILCFVQFSGLHWLPKFLKES